MKRNGNEVKGWEPASTVICMHPREARIQTDYEKICERDFNFFRKRDVRDARAICRRPEKEAWSDERRDVGGKEQFHRTGAK